MNAMELLTTRRTYRRFAQKAVPQDVVDDIVQIGAKVKKLSYHHKNIYAFFMHLYPYIQNRYHFKF